MNYSRITPKARNGTAGVSIENNIGSNQGVWINPPERVAAVTVAVHIPEGAQAEYLIQATCNSVDTIGQNGNGGYWDNVEAENPFYTEDKVLMIANAVTGIRVFCNSITNGYELNVCFVG